MSRQSVVSVRLAGLERAQRFAGESFGHEELGALPGRGFSAFQQTRVLWALAGFAAVMWLAAVLVR